AELGANDSNHVEPLLVHLDMLDDGIRLSKQAGFGALSQNGNRGSMGAFALVEKTALHYSQIDNLFIVRPHTVNYRHVMLRLRHHAARSESFAGRPLDQSGNIGLNYTEIAQGEAKRGLSDLLEVFPGVRLVGFHDHIAHSHLL